MNIGKSLSTLAVAGAMVSVAAVAGAQSMSDHAIQGPSADQRMQGPSANHGIQAPSACAPGEQCTNAPTASDRPVVEGQVAAVDESGRMVLRTESGLVALRLSPEEVQGVSVGDTVRVALLDDEDQDDIGPNTDTGVTTQ